MLRGTRWKARAVLLLGLMLIAGCGGGQDEEETSAARTSERAFLQAMVPHHESAIEMATIARQRGQDPFVKQLAADITTAQEREIAQIRRIHHRLFGSALKPDPGAHEALSLSMEEAGMTHSEDDNEKLRNADPFDREFVDMMVPHHRGATRMAQAVLAKTKDAELRKLARGIISMQQKEIKEMNAFRERHFRGPAPASGGGHGGGHER